MITKCTARRYTDATTADRSWCARPWVIQLPRGELRALLKRLLLGRAMRSDKLGDTLLPKRLALPIFASDALSSVAYAPDEIFLMLGLAGGAFVVTHSWQVALAVVLVMVVVVASYRQNVHAYPSGGGDYEVATVNLGPKAGLTVASALLVDYVLTVAVSISSGVQNAATAIAVAARPRGPGRRRPRRLPHGDEPARRARVRQGLRRPGRMRSCSASWGWASSASSRQ